MAEPASPGSIGGGASPTMCSTCTARVIATYSRRAPRGVPSRISCGLTTTTPSNSSPFTASAREDRDLVVGRVLHMVDGAAARRAASAVGDRRRRSRRARRRRCCGGGAAPRATSAATASASASAVDQHASTAASPSARTLRLAIARHVGERQQAVGDVEDRAGHAVADRQAGDAAGSRWRGGGDSASLPVLLAGGSGRLGEVAEDRHRPVGLRRPIDPQRDRRVVLRLVDDDVAERERRAVEQRVGLVDAGTGRRRSTLRRLPAGTEPSSSSSRSTSRDRLHASATPCRARARSSGDCSTRRREPVRRSSSRCDDRLQASRAAC